MSKWPIACVTVMLLAGSVDGETIYLRDGHRLEGAVIKENANDVFVDLGYTILTVPRSSIQRIEKDKPVEADAAAMAADEIKSEDLYSTKDLPEASVRLLAERFGEGVVMVRTPGGLGSGFIIDERGYIVTNFHVIEGETKITIVIFRKVGDTFQRDKIDNTRIIATNPFLDLALLKMEPPEGMKLSKVYVDDSDGLRDGEKVFAIGNPLGLERTVSEGIVSKRNRTESGLVYIQTTTQINPGNSGGPLFNARGQVVGVTNMKLMFGEGLGFAIPARHVLEFLRNRDAFAYDSDNPSSGHHYLQPVGRKESAIPGFLTPARKTDGEPRRPSAG
jgi:serine protease Do